MIFNWLPPRDSNPDMLIQSQLSPQLISRYGNHVSETNQITLVLLKRFLPGSLTYFNCSSLPTFIHVMPDKIPTFPDRPGFSFQCLTRTQIGERLFSIKICAPTKSPNNEVPYVFQCESCCLQSSYFYPWFLVSNRARTS